MPAGNVVPVLVCVASPDGTTLQPCPAGQQPAAVSAYLLDGSSSGFFDTAFSSVDPEIAAGFWAASFISVLSIYLFSRYIGDLIGMVKRL